MDQYSSEELNSMFNNSYVSVLDHASFDRYTDRILQAKSGVPLWKYAVMLALLFLLAEVLLIRFLK